MSKKKYIGIETIIRDVLLVNYGSIFQHFALRKILTGFGYRVFRCERESFKCEKFTIFFPLRLARLKFLSMLGIRDKPSARFIQRGWLRFGFVVDYWRLIGRLFEKQQRDDVVAYVAGGDSVWCRTVRSDFLLDKKPSVRRISYGASSAWDKCSKDQQWCNCIRDVVRTFSAIGVRENAGVDAIMTICPNAKVSVVLDPVLLLEKGELFNVIGHKRRQFKKPTLLYYAVNIWDAKSLNLSVIEETANRMRCDLKIVGIQGAEDFVPEQYVIRPSPRQFLAMVRDAEYFITNSFHGVVFSIMLQKQFAFIAQGAKRYGDQNCRQRELLTRYSLINRYLPAYPSSQSIAEILLRSWDQNFVDKELKIERDRCKLWLKEALHETR